MSNANEVTRQAGSDELIARVPAALAELDDEAIARVRAPLERAWTLPTAAYTSTAIYDAEVERIMRRQWLPVARIDQLPEPGSYLTLELFDQPVLVVHGRDGAIRALSSVCLHRGAPIVDGCGRRNLFTCPYHAWSYDTTGQLVRAPLMEGAEDFEPAELRLPELRSELWQGFVMVNLDPDAAPFAPSVQDFADRFADFDLEAMTLARTLEFDSAWNWKVLVENFMEAYHHIATHSTSLESIFNAADSQVPDNTGPWSILHMPPSQAAKAMAEQKPDAEPVGDLFATVLFPHFLLGIQAGSVAWYQVLPSAADRLLLRIHLLVHRDALAAPDAEALLEHFAQTVSTIHHEDIEANDRVWSGLRAPLTEQGRLSPLEKGIWQLNQWWLDEMGAPRA